MTGRVRGLAIRDRIGAAAAAGSVACVAALAVIAATPADSYWIVDCGAKALLSEQLWASGFRSVELPTPAAHLDPDGAAFPIVPPFAARRGDRFFSQYPPAYPALAAPFLAAFGPRGLRVPAALGLAACAGLFAWWVAPVFGARWAAAGGLALALATPLFFYGVTVWEHSLTVALPLAGVVVLTQRSPRRLATAGALVAAACWLREELVFALPALAGACFWIDRRARDIAWLGVGALPVLAALLVINAAAYGDPLGVHVAPNLRALPQLAAVARATGAVASGLGRSAGEGGVLALAACAAWGLGVCVRRSDRHLAAATAGAAGIGLLLWGRGATAIAGAEIPFVELARWNGLALQLPLACLAGIGAVRLLRVGAFAPLRLGIAAGLGFLALVLPVRVAFSDFASGGHWGPRMLLPAAPALLALSLAAVRARAAEPAPGHRLRRLAWALLVLAGLGSSALSVALLDAQKAELAALQHRIASAPQTVVVTTHPAHGQLFPQLWREKELLLAQDPPALERVIAGLARAGTREFLLVWRPAPGYGPRRITGAHCVPAGRHVGRRVKHLFDAEFLGCVLPAGGSSSLPGAPTRPQGRLGHRVGAAEVSRCPACGSTS